MDILFVAIPRGNEPVAYAPNLVESPSLHDYDALVVDMDWVWPPDLRQDIQREPGQNYVTWANRSEYERFNYPIQAKREEATFLLKKGGIIICLMQPPMGVCFADFSSKLQVFSYDWIPVKGLSEIVRPANGTRVKKVRRTPFDDYLDLDGVFWNADLRKTNQVDYSTVAANDAGLAIAAEMRAEGSSIFLLPFSSHEEGFHVLRDCVKKAWDKYVERIPPDWIAGWVVPREQEIVGKLRNVQKQINSLRMKSKHCLRKLGTK